MSGEVNTDREVNEAFDAMLELSKGCSSSSEVALKLLRTVYSEFEYPFVLEGLLRFDSKNIVHAKVLINLVTVYGHAEKPFHKYLRENNLETPDFSKIDSSWTC